MLKGGELAVDLMSTHQLWLYVHNESVRFDQQMTGQTSPAGREARWRRLNAAMRELRLRGTQGRFSF